MERLAVFNARLLCRSTVRLFGIINCDIDCAFNNANISLHALFAEIFVLGESRGWEAVLVEARQATLQVRAAWGASLLGRYDKTFTLFSAEVSTSNWLFSRTTVSQDVQTRFPVQLAFAKFLSRIKGNF